MIRILAVGGGFGGEGRGRFKEDGGIVNYVEEK